MKKSSSQACLSFALGDEYAYESSQLNPPLVSCSSEEHTIYVRELVEWGFFCNKPMSELDQRTIMRLANQNPEILKWDRMPHFLFIGQTDPNCKTVRKLTKNFGGDHVFGQVNYPKDIWDTMVHPHLASYNINMLRGFLGSSEIAYSFDFENIEEFADYAIEVLEKIRDTVTFDYNSFEKKYGEKFSIVRKLSKDTLRDDPWGRFIPDKDHMVLRERSKSFDPLWLPDFVKKVLSYHPDPRIAFVPNDAYGNFSEQLLKFGKGLEICTDGLLYNGIYNNVTLISNSEVYNMNTPDIQIGNPPFQRPKGDKKGKGGNNALAADIAQDCINRARKNGVVALLTPASVLMKTTVLHRPSNTLSLMKNTGSLEEIDFTANNCFSVGTTIVSWIYIKGKDQVKNVKIITDHGIYYENIDNLYFYIVKATQLERNLFKKIVSNKEGEYLKVYRDKTYHDCYMYRNGYPYLQERKLGEEYPSDAWLGFDKKFYGFLSSKLGLWLLDYMRRYDQQHYHNLLTGIMIPKDGFSLTDEEKRHIEEGDWKNEAE